MTSISKSVYIDKLDYIVNNFNNIYHSTIKIKRIDVKSSTSFDSNKEINKKDLKPKIRDVDRISNTSNWS